ncbi:MAG: hypothetical protein QM811_27000 [Pirellulales bacterium]
MPFGDNAVLAVAGGRGLDSGNAGFGPISRGRRPDHAGVIHQRSSIGDSAGRDVFFENPNFPLDAALRRASALVE